MKFTVCICFLFMGLFSAQACTCREPDSVKNVYKHTDFIVHGKILLKKRVSVLETIDPIKSNEILEKYKEECRKIQTLEALSVIQVDVEIIELFKGSIQKDTVTIFTYVSTASCGFPWFEVGKEYLIYANHHNYWRSDEITDHNMQKDTYWTNHCTRTTLYNKWEGGELEQISRAIKKD